MLRYHEKSASFAILCLTGFLPPCQAFLLRGGHGSSSMNRSNTLFFHFHIPKTAGTTVSNMIVGNICGEEMRDEGWDKKCSRSCERAFVDTELSCLDPDRWESEHRSFLTAKESASKLRDAHEIQNVVYVTTLRSGPERLISQWAMETTYGWWAPPSDVPAMSNESLLLYISGGFHGGNGSFFSTASPYPTRNNLQVAELASVPLGYPVLPQDLETAKTVFLSNDWLVGFSACLPKFQARLAEIGQIAPMAYANEAAPGKDLVLRRDIVELIQQQSKFDDQLLEWALQRSYDTPEKFTACEDQSLFAPLTKQMNQVELDDKLVVVKMFED